MPRVLAVTLIALLLVTALEGCHPLFCTWELGYSSVMNEPSNKQLTGRYLLSSNSRKYLQGLGYQVENGFIELTSENRFLMRDAPDNLFDDWGNSNRDLIQKTGRWYMSWSKEEGVTIELEGVCVIPLQVKDGKYSILIPVGDGDECNGIVYERSSPSQ